MKFREVLLVIVLILAGLVVYQIKTGHWNLAWDWNWGWEDGFGAFGREYASEETRTIEAPLPAAIEVDNDHGWVEVRGGDQANVQMTFKKVVWRKSEEEAKDVADKLKYTLTNAADKIVLSTNRGEFRKRNFETGFILTVPRALVARVTNSYGAVRVEGVKEATVRNRHGEVFAADIDGPCTLETSYEDVDAQRIKGACSIIDSHSDVRALSITGDLKIETSYARIRVEDAGGKADLRGSNVDVDARRVAGAVTVDTSYEKVLLADVGPAIVTGHNMAVTADNVRGDLEVQTSYEEVRATGVQGRLIVDAHNAAVTATRISGGEISVTTSYENVKLAEFSADVTVVCKNGNVTLEPLDLKHGMDVRNEYGSVDLAWPDGETARLEARAKGGRVQWGLPGKPDVDETNGVSLIKAFAGSEAAPMIYLSTTYDDIKLTPASRKF
jgi:DUF4097 and DUF4098 domain-containing protein YvlB